MGIKYLVCESTYFKVLFFCVFPYLHDLDLYYWNAQEVHFAQYVPSLIAGAHQAKDVLRVEKGPSGEGRHQQGHSQDERSRHSKVLSSQFSR